MNTSYFGSNKIKGLSDLVSISYKPPEYFLSIVKICKPLCPSYDLVMSYKNGIITEYEYTREYHRQILDGLDPKTMFKKLGENSILLCYEKSGDFCHRRIVAKWFEDNLNVKVPEL